MFGVTSVSRPSVNSIMKNNTDHRGAGGICVTASGYTINASPTPAIKFNGKLVSVAITLLMGLVQAPSFWV